MPDFDFVNLPFFAMSHPPPDLDPEMLQIMLASLQASNKMVIKTWTYPMPKFTIGTKLIGEEIHRQAEILFQQKKPDYRLKNLHTRKLTRNVLKILAEALKTKPETVDIPNGCCSLETCPTKLYYECVLEAAAANDVKN